MPPINICKYTHNYISISFYNCLPDVHILIPRICECYLIWKGNLCRSLIKLKILRWDDHPGLSGWAPNPITSAQTRRRQREILQKRAHTEDRAMRTWRQRLEGCGHQPRRPRNSHRHREDGPREGFFPRASKGHGPADTLVSDFWPPKLWDDEYLQF